MSDATATIRKLLPQLKGPDAGRRQAMLELKSFDEPSWAAVPAKVIASVIEALGGQLHAEDRGPLVRQEVTAILSKIGHRAEPAVPLLMELLAEGNPDAVRESAAATLAKIGPGAAAAVEPLVALFTHSRSSVALQAIRAIGDIGSSEASVESALNSLWNSTTASRAVIVETGIALSKLKIRTHNKVKFLANVLSASPEAPLRIGACEGLSYCGKDEVDVVPALLAAALNDRDDRVKEVAQAALKRLELDTAGAIAICVKQLKHAGLSETALKHSGPAAIGGLVNALASADPTTREKAARILGSLGEAGVEAVPALTKALRHSDADFRLAAAKCLWNITKNADLVTNVLVDLLYVKRTGEDAGEDAHRRYLQTVIEAIWRIGPAAQDAVPALLEMSKHRNRLVADSAKNALKEIAPAKVAARGK